jgi:hypothetical protein
VAISTPRTIYTRLLSLRPLLRALFVSCHHLLTKPNCSLLCSAWIDSSSVRTNAALSHSLPTSTIGTTNSGQDTRTYTQSHSEDAPRSIVMFTRGERPLWQCCVVIRCRCKVPRARPPRVHGALNTSTKKMEQPQDCPYAAWGILYRRFIWLSIPRRPVEGFRMICGRSSLRISHPTTGFTELQAGV